MAIFKIVLTLPAWQDKIIRQVIKEEEKENPNDELLEKAKNACIKTKDENFMFAFAYYTYNPRNRREIVQVLLNRNAKKWAIPCVKEIKSELLNNSLVIIQELCINALIKDKGYEELYALAKVIGHNDRILDYLIENNKIHLVMDYAKNVEGCDFPKVSKFINTFLSGMERSVRVEYQQRFDKICRRKVKKSKSLNESLRLMGEDMEK